MYIGIICKEWNPKMGKGLWNGDSELNKLVVAIKVNYECCSVNKLGNLNLKLWSSK